MSYAQQSLKVKVRDSNTKRPLRIELFPVISFRVCWEKFCEPRAKTAKRKKHKEIKKKTEAMEKRKKISSERASN